MKYLIGVENQQDQKNFLDMTPEEKKEYLNKMSQQAWAGLTPEEKAQKMRKIKVSNRRFCGKNVELTKFCFL